MRWTNLGWMWSMLRGLARANVQGWRPLGPIQFPRIATNRQAFRADFGAVDRDMVAAARALRENPSPAAPSPPTNTPAPRTKK